MIESPTAVEFAALGTTARVAVIGCELGAARDLLGEELDAIDRACSRFRSDSELATVNEGEGRPIGVGPLLLDAVETALRAARLTEGRVDPTVGTALRLLGYDRDFALVEADGPALRIRVERVPGWQLVEVDRARSTVCVPGGVRLDLGATAKALAADRAAQRIARELDAGVLVSLGGDIAIAGSAPPEGWAVRVADDHARPDDPPRETIALGAGGLATSSTVVRRWQRGTETRHHVIDPATGLSAREVFRTVSVAAATCVDANIASTAALVLGDDAPTWLAARGLPARLVTHDGQVCYVAAWPEARDVA